MTVHAWQVVTWNTLKIPVVDWEALVGKLQHTSASYYFDEREPAAAKGQVLWSTDTGDTPVGLAWDWAEVRDRLLVLADPMAVVSNIALVDEDGTAIDPREQLVRLNDMIHSLPWQERLIESRKHWPA
jgi:hypothetical protein